jgi:hypothetical protein
VKPAHTANAAFASSSVVDDGLRSFRRRWNSSPPDATALSPQKRAIPARASGRSGSPMNHDAACGAARMNAVAGSQGQVRQSDTAVVPTRVIAMKARVTMSGLAPISGGAMSTLTSPKAAMSCESDRTAMIAVTTAANRATARPTGRGSTS